MSSGLSSFLSAGRKKPGKAVMPQVTSLVDMMTILLVFLLKSFSAEGNIITPSQDLALPTSTAKDPPRTALMVEVTSSSVLVEGKVVVTMDDIMAADSLVVPRLFDWLSGLAATFKGQETQHEAVIQCDKNCDFKYLKKVMATCARASFSNFTLLVVQKG